MGNVTSPCTNVCQLDKNKICIGCRRTIDEIANWTKYTDIEKKNIIDQIEVRKDEIF